MTKTPKQCRGGDKCEPTTFAEAADCLGHHSAHSIREMCERTVQNENRMRKVFSLYDEANVLRGDLIVPFTLASGDEPSARNYVLIELLCRQVGGTFVHLPRVAVEDSEYMRAVAQLIERAGALTTEISESLRDRRVDNQEHQKLRARTHALHQIVAEIEAMVDQSAGVDPVARKVRQIADVKGA